MSPPVMSAKLAEGNRVCFTTNDGTAKHAVVLRLNKKTASLLTDDGQNCEAAATSRPGCWAGWTTSPSHRAGGRKRPGAIQLTVSGAQCLQ